MSARRALAIAATIVAGVLCFGGLVAAAGAFPW